MSVKSKQKVFIPIVFHYFIIYKSFNCGSYIFFTHAMFESGWVELNGNIHISSILSTTIKINHFFIPQYPFNRTFELCGIFECPVYYFVGGRWIPAPCHYRCFSDKLKKNITTEVWHAKHA